MCVLTLLEKGRPVERGLAVGWPERPGPASEARKGHHMNQENLARQAELALDRQGGHDFLFDEGRTLCGLLACTVQRRERSSPGEQTS